MILIDANLLLYAKFARFPQHSAAKQWLDAQLSTEGRVGLPWASLLAFLRLSTSPALFPRPLSMEAAWTQVREWLSQPPAFSPGPAEAHAAMLDELIRGHAITARLVGDAHLAAIAIEHGLVLCSADEDFARFHALRWTNPLSPASKQA